ncbi:MAG: hypothetical protein ACTIOO_01640 [Pseudolactococcus laudensis]
MKIDDITLKSQCSNCGKDILLTYNTTKCPLCGNIFPPGSVKEIFHDYESQVVNSKANKVAAEIGRTSEGLKVVGEAMSAIGCLIILIPILIVLFMIMKLFLSL